MDGDAQFKPLSYYRLIEDGNVRGDSSEGTVLSKPEAGLVIHNETQGSSYVIPEGAILSSARLDEIFILCGSNSMSDELQVRFEADCCVEILKVSTFCARLRAQLPESAIFRAGNVDYYSQTEEMGIRWALPDKIAFSKVREKYAWQREYRFAFSITDALHNLGKTAQQVIWPSQDSPARPSADAPRKLTALEPITLSRFNLRDICRLHLF